MPTPSGHTTAIRASDVIGAPVKSSSGTTIGKVEDVVLDKMNNAIMFAVVGFGGFLGVGEKYHPIPWMSLDFDPDAEAYVVNYSKEELEKAPSRSINELTRDDGVAARDAAYEYYQAQPYWQNLNTAISSARTAGQPRREAQEENRHGALPVRADRSTGNRLTRVAPSTQ